MFCSGNSQSGGYEHHGTSRNTSMKFSYSRTQGPHRRNTAVADLPQKRSSFTWNAPLESLTDPNQFFKGQGADSVHGPIIKSHEFLGMTQIPSFQNNDVVKNTDFPTFIKNFEAHLTKYFGKQ